VTAWAPRVGESVVYRPTYGPAEDGVVTGVSARAGYVFVRYAGQHPSAPGKATHVSDLEPASSGC
jgi:hypothetical protein